MIFVYRNGKLVDKRIAGLKNEGGLAPYVISDTMPETRHMVTNKHYTSKHKFREATKATGNIEYGNDPALTRPRKPVPLSREKRRDDIRRTIYNLRNGIRND